MSYINDALRKVQKEKQSDYAVYGDIIYTSDKKAHYFTKIRAIIIILIVFIITGGMTLLFWQVGKKEVLKAYPGRPTSIPLSQTEKKPLTNNIIPKQTDILQSPKSLAISRDETKKTSPLTESKKSNSEFKERRKIINTEALFKQAMNKQQEGNLDKAKLLYKEVIKRDPRNAQALNNLGVVHMSQKNYKWAIRRFNKALTVKSDYADAHYNLACLYSQTKEVARSFHHLKTAVKINPEVRQWAINDKDLKELSQYSEFKKLMDGKMD